VNSVVREGESI